MCDILNQENQIEVQNHTTKMRLSGTPVMTVITLKRLHAKRDATCADEAANKEKTCREKYDEQLAEVRDERDEGMDSPVKFIWF